MIVVFSVHFSQNVVSVCVFVFACVPGLSPVVRPVPDLDLARAPRAEVALAGLIPGEWGSARLPERGRDLAQETDLAL